MASSAKQQKRAKRAAAKAKQNRVTRSHASSKAEETPPPIDKFFDTAMGAGLYEELFENMKEAQQTSLRALCKVFLEDPLLSIVVGTYDEEESADYIYWVLCEYRNWLDDLDYEEATEWIQSAEFIEAYEEASRQIEAETAAEQ